MPLAPLTVRLLEARREAGLLAARRLCSYNDRCGKPSETGCDFCIPAGNALAADVAKLIDAEHDRFDADAFRAAKIAKERNARR